MLVMWLPLIMYRSHMEIQMALLDLTLDEVESWNWYHSKVASISCIIWWYRVPAGPAVTLPLLLLTSFSHHCGTHSERDFTSYVGLVTVAYIHHAYESILKIRVYLKNLCGLASMRVGKRGRSNPIVNTFVFGTLLKAVWRLLPCNMRISWLSFGMLRIWWYCPVFSAKPALRHDPLWWEGRPTLIADLAAGGAEYIIWHVRYSLRAWISKLALQHDI